MKIKLNIETIPHNDQRYETVGDYWVDDDGTIQIRVSEMENPDHEFLVALHETVEQMVYGYKNRQMRYTAIDIADDFDMRYENCRPAWDETSEPGYEDVAPYYREHMIASAIEHLVAMELGVNYNVYGRVVSSLTQEKK